jgi:hypothetical protein
MSFLKRVGNLGKGLIGTIGSSREEELKLKALEEELKRHTSMASSETAGKAQKPIEKPVEKPIEKGEPLDPLSRPPVKRTL